MISVLYVEDDTSLLEIGKFLLEKDGTITVDTCSSVNDALEKISGKRYDVIISDYAMPVTNGMKFLKNLRSGGDTTPFFFFAGKGRKSVIIDALNLGADFYLEKAGNAKVQFEELMTEVKRAAERTSVLATVDRSQGIPGLGLDAVADGVLVVDPWGKIVAFNQNFLSLLKIPEDLTGIGSDSPVLLKYIQDRLGDPDDFSRKIAAMSSDPGITCQGTIHAQEGQVFSWSSQARKTGDTISGRIWSFRDISEHARTGIHLATATEQAQSRRRRITPPPRRTGKEGGADTEKRSNPGYHQPGNTRMAYSPVVVVPSPERTNSLQTCLDTALLNWQAGPSLMLSARIHPVKF